MSRFDRIKLNFTRHWKFPGRERLANFFKPSKQYRTKMTNGIIWLTEEDIGIFTSADNYIENTILGTGTYEDEINKLIRISLKSGGYALDIGGNIGLQSIRMSKCAGETGVIFAFEPLHHLQEKFTRNLLLNQITNVRLLPVALSDEEGEFDFKINNHAWNQGTFSLSQRDEVGDVQKVAVRIGDRVAEIQNIGKLDLIKIDVEGFEFNVIRGLSKTLEKHLPRIIFEFDQNYWCQNNQKIALCYDFLKRLQYDVYQVTPSGCILISHPEEITGGNLFCMTSIARLR